MPLPSAVAKNSTKVIDREWSRRRPESCLCARIRASFVRVPRSQSTGHSSYARLPSSQWRAHVVLRFSSSVVLRRYVCAYLPMALYTIWNSVATSVCLSRLSPSLKLYCAVGLAQAVAHFRDLGPGLIRLTIRPVQWKRGRSRGARIPLLMEDEVTIDGAVRVGPCDWGGAPCFMAPDCRYRDSSTGWRMQ